MSRDGAQQFYDVCYVVCVCACAEVGEGEKGREAGRQAGRQAGREAGREAGRQAGRQAGREAGRQGGRGGGGREGKADIIYNQLAAKRKQSYYWTTFIPGVAMSRVWLKEVVTSCQFKGLRKRRKLLQTEQHRKQLWEWGPNR